VPADACREEPRPAGQFLARQADQVVAHPAAEMSRVAADPDLAVDDRHRRRFRVALAADPVRRPEHRHDRSLDERDGARQSLQPGDNPAALRLEKAQPVLGRDAARQHQLDRPVRRVDPQQQAPRPRIDPNRQGRAEVEGQCPAAHILDGSGGNPAAPTQLHEPIPPMPRPAPQKLPALVTIWQAAAR